MLSLEEQISRKCIHFNGVMNKTCMAGVSYADVRVDKPYKFPCLKQGGECNHAEFRTEEQVKAEVAAIEDNETRALKAYCLIKDHIQKTQNQTGKIKCVCGGELNYVVAKTNGHIWARCKDCGISFNQ